MIHYVMKPYMIETAFTLMEAVLWDAFRQPAVKRDFIHGSDGDILVWGDLSGYHFEDLRFASYSPSRHPSRPKCPSPTNPCPASRVYIVEEKVRSITGDEIVEKVMRLYPQSNYDPVYPQDDLNRYYDELDAYYKQRERAIEKSKLRILGMLLDGDLSAYGFRNSRVRMKYEKLEGFPDLYEGDVMPSDFHQNNKSVSVTDSDDFSENTFYAYDGASVQIDKDNWNMDSVDWDRSLLMGDGGYFDITIDMDGLFKKIPMSPVSSFSTSVCDGIVYSRFDGEVNFDVPSRKVGRPQKYNREDIVSFLDQNRNNLEGTSQEYAAHFLSESWFRKYGQEMPSNTAMSFIKRYRAGAGHQ